MKATTDIFPVDSDKQLQAVPEGTYRVYVKANIFSEEVVFANVPCEIAVWDLLGQPSNPDGFYVEIDGGGVPAELLRGLAANPGQLVDIKRVPGDDDFLRILLNIALIVASIYVPGLTSLGKFGQAVLGATILTAGQIAINALIPFEQPDLTSTQPAALNNIGATRNRLEPFAVIPRIFGKVRQYPPYAANPFTEVLGNDIWLNALFCIGEGSKFDVTDIRIGTTELINMSDVALVKTTAPEYPDVFQENLNIELKQVALDPSGDEAIRATQKNTTRASIDIAMPRGLAAFKDDGERVAWTLDFSIEFRVKGSSDVWDSVTFEDWRQQTEENKGTFGNPLHTFEDENGEIIFSWPRGGANTGPSIAGAGGRRGSGGGVQPRTQLVRQSSDDAAHFRLSLSTIDAFRVSVKWTFPSSGEWDVRVKRRGSFNPANGIRIITTNELYTESRIADVFLFTTLRSFNDNNVTAVDSGGDIWYMQLRIKASDQLSGALDNFNYIAESYTRPYDGNTWLAPTKNRSPAWAFAEVLTGNSSAEPVPDVDLIADELKLWDDWATDNNFTFDFEFVDEQSMFDVLNRIASAGRAALSQREGKFTVITDNEQTSPVQMFTRRNSRNFKGTKVFLDTLHGVKVRWRSENEDYQWTEREVYNTGAGFDESNATRFEVLELLGIVQDDQAFKMALRYMAEAIHRPEFYFLDTDFENLIAQRGDTVLVQNERMLVGTASARIESIVGLVVTLDQGGFIVESTKSYVLRFRTQIGQESNPQSVDITVANVTSPTSAINVSAFTVDAVPASAKKGDMVVFGELTSDTIRCKVVEVFPKDNLEASLALTIEAAAIYDADSGDIPPYVPIISTIPDPANVVPPIPFIVAIESSGFIGTQQAGGILILKAVISYNIDLIGTGYGGPVFIQVGYREYDQDNDTEAGALKFSEWMPHDQGNITITNLADNQVYQFFIRSRSVHGTVSLFSLGKEHLVSGAPGVAIQPVDLFTVASTVLGVTLNLDVTNVIQKNLQHLEIKYSTVNNRDGDGSPDPIPNTFIAPLPNDLASQTQFEIFVPLADNIVRFFWARLVNIYDQASTYFPLSATAGLDAAAFQFPSPTQFIQLTYDDLDTTQLAADKSRYAMLTDVATDTSGSQNNFQLTDAILLNKKDKAGANHALLLAEIREGDKIVFKVGLTRWFVFEIIDTEFEVVGTGVAEAYKFDVFLLEFSDSDPTVNIPTAAGTDVTFEIHKSNFDTAQQVIIDPDFDLSTALTGPQGTGVAEDVTSNPGSANMWAWAFETTGITQGLVTEPTVQINVGGGVANSNSLFIKQTLYESQAPLTPPDNQQIRVWHVHRFRTTNPSFNIKIRARNEGTDRDTTLRIIMSGFDLPRGGAFIESLTQLPVQFVVPKSTTTYKEYSYHVSGADTLAQYWQFAIAIFEVRGTGWQTAADLQEVEIDSIFVESTNPKFGKVAFIGSTDVVAGLVPGSDSTETGKFLRADGLWEDPPGGSAPVTSVFTRTGAIVALQADYDGFFLTPAEGDAAYSLLGHSHVLADITDSGALAALATVDTAEIDNNAVTLAKLADIATARLLGRVTAATGDPEVLTGTQATTLLDALTDSLKGLAPASGGGTDNFLRADATWALPPGSGGGALDDLSDVTITAATVGEFLRHNGAGQFVDTLLIAGDIPGLDAAKIISGLFDADRIPTHTGDVTGQTALSLAVAAITGQTALTTGLAGTDELLLSDAGVLKRMDISVMNAYFDANLNFNLYTHPNHSGDVTSVADGAQTIVADAVTYAKMQNVVADDRILGNVAGAGGIVAELTAALVRTMINVEDNSAADQTAGEIEAIVNHDNLLGFLAAEHVDWAATGAENLATDRSANSVLALTADEVTQLANIDGTAISAADWVAVAALLGVNTGDQTSIVGITGTKAQFDTAVTDGDIAYVGGAHHDGFSDFVALEHLDWTLDQGANNFHANNFAAGANFADTAVNRAHLGDFAIEHQVVAAIATTVINYESGQSVLLNMGGVNIDTLTLNNWPVTGRLGQYEFEIKQGATPRTIAWPAAVDWVTGAAPNLSTANETYLIHLSTRNAGTNIIGSFATDSSAGVISVFGRSGAVVALLADYDSFFLTPAEGNAAYSLLGHSHTLADITDSGVLAALATVGTSEIDNDSVTYAKMQNVVADDRILGNIVGAGGIVAELTAAQVRTMINVENASTADQTAAEIEAIVNHDNLLGFLAAEHVDWAATGAENLATDRSANAVLALTSGEVTQLANIGATVITLADWVAVAALLGVNTGDQTSIVGITGTAAQFDTALTAANFAFAGGAFHDGFSDFVANEHIDWSAAGAENLQVDRFATANFTGLVNMQDNILRRALMEDFAVDHQVVTGVASTTINYVSGQSVLLNLSADDITTLTITNWPVTGRLGQLEIEITQGATPRTIAWDTAIAGTVEWTGGVEPDLNFANGKIMVHLSSRDAKTTLVGSYSEDHK